MKTAFSKRQPESVVRTSPEKAPPSKRRRRTQFALGVSSLLASVTGLSYSMSQHYRAHYSNVEVATTDLFPGESISAADISLEQIALIGSSQTLFPDQAHLVGSVVGSQVLSGEVIEASMLASTPPSLHLIEVPLTPDEALSGAVEIGGTVEVAVTYGSGAAATTQVVAPVATVVAIRGGGQSLATSSSGSLDVELSFPNIEEALATLQGEAAGKVTLIRSNGGGGFASYPPIPQGPPVSQVSAGA